MHVLKKISIVLFFFFVADTSAADDYRYHLSFGAGYSRILGTKFLGLIWDGYDYDKDSMHLALRFGFSLSRRWYLNFDGTWNCSLSSRNIVALPCGFSLSVSGIFYIAPTGEFFGMYTSAEIGGGMLVYEPIRDDGDLFKGGPVIVKIGFGFDDIFRNLGLELKGGLYFPGLDTAYYKESYLVFTLEILLRYTVRWGERSSGGG
ncbi:MAG: hypothetical protein D6806_04525 [Deltaproteobacteria bacterium]|nr:MAG: hypothetical protein D6806_04525 [Deltaproteobacteria bacterium]